MLESLFFFNFKQKILWKPMNRFRKSDAQGTGTELKRSLMKLRGMKSIFSIVLFSVSSDFYNIFSVPESPNLPRVSCSCSICSLTLLL